MASGETNGLVIRVEARYLGPSRYCVLSVSVPERTPLDSSFVGNYRQTLVERLRRFDRWCGEAEVSAEIDRVELGDMPTQTN